VVEQIHGLLVDGGLFVVNYPDYGSLARKILRRKWPFLLSVHLIYFTRKTIRKFLEERGFEVLEIRPFWQTLELGYVLGRAGAYFGVFSTLARVVERIGLGRIPCAYNMGQSTVIARKRS